MAKYIFLDIDGVLNSRLTRAKAPYDCKGIGKKHLAVLKEIVNQTDGEIVLISDWRLSFLPNDHMPLMADYIATTLNKQGLSLELVSTNHQYEIRSKEIKEWIKTHKTEGYIILDDGDDKWYNIDSIRPHWVHTDYRKGLTEEHIPEAISKMMLPVIPIEF